MTPPDLGTKAMPQHRQEATHGRDVRLQAGPRGRRRLRDRDRRARQGRRRAALPRRRHRGPGRPGRLRQRLGRCWSTASSAPGCRRPSRSRCRCTPATSGSTCSARSPCWRRTGGSASCSTSPTSRPATTWPGSRSPRCRSWPSRPAGSACRRCRRSEIDKARTIVERFMIRWRGEPDPRPRQGGRRVLRLGRRARHERVHVHRPGRRLHRRRRRPPAISAAHRRAVRPAARRRPVPGAAHDRGRRAHRRRRSATSRACSTAGERLMGFGHRVYRAEDPRARVLRRTAKELGRAAVRGRRGAGEGRARGAARAASPTGCSRTNVEFWSAVVLDFAEVPPHMFTSMFTCARTAGWSAHILEQKRLSRLVRPSAPVRRPGAAQARGRRGLGRHAAGAEYVTPPDGTRCADGRSRTMESVTPSSDPACPTTSSRATAGSAAGRPRSARRRWPRWPSAGATVTGHVAPAGAGARTWSHRLRRGLADAVLPARRLRGRARQRRHHRVLGRGRVRAGPGAGRSTSPSASSARSSPT